MLGFHRPQELLSEIAEANFRGTEIFAVEGPAWLAPDFEARWSDTARREQLLDLVRRVESELLLLAVSAHWLAVASKPPE